MEKYLKFDTKVNKLLYRGVDFSLSSNLLQDLHNGFTNIDQVLPYLEKMYSDYISRIRCLKIKKIYERR